MSLSGFLSAFAGAWVAYLVFNQDRNYQIAGWAVIVILVVLFFVTIRQGIRVGLGAIAGAFTGVGAIAAGVGAIAVGAIVFTVAGGGAIVFTVAGAGVVAGAIAVTFTGALPFALIGAIAVAGAVVLLSTFISWRALKGDPKHALIRDIAIAFAAFRGTSFRSANLSNANFTEATIKSTDFRKANLTRICFHKTKKLDRVRPGSSYLQIAEVRQVLATGHGSDKNFDRQDLRGVNFRGAKLVDASFISTDLNEANLQDADLSRVKLVQAQLDGTDFTGATLTRAYIKDWNITSDTNFNGVRCEYVYMRLPTKENPDPLRKPDNDKEVFADGEFGDFIQPIFDTLDLYHNQGVDPRAIAISFKQLAENHPDAELRIVGMEVRGEDKFLLRAKTAHTADKSELSAEYFIIYNELKVLAQQELKALMAEKDKRIYSLETMINTALQSPNFYAENYHNQGDTTMGGEHTINIGSGNYNESIQGNYIQGDYSQ